MKHLTSAFALLTTFAIAACDAPSQRLACDDAAVDFRNGDPETLYLSQYDAEVTVFDFAEMVLACPAKPKLAVTFTRYQPDVTFSDAHVIGLGFSVTANSEWAQCYEDMMLSMGAHPLP